MQDLTPALSSENEARTDNARFYSHNNLPFVMGTTGGDREQLMEDTRRSGVYAVIAPQMGKQVCYDLATSQLWLSIFLFLITCMALLDSWTHATAAIVDYNEIMLRLGKDFRRDELVKS